MVRHTSECRQRGYPFIADPSQQLAFSDGALIRDLIDGAAYLFSNEYESHMIEAKTGWTAEEILDRVGVQVTTLGKDGVRIRQRGHEDIVVKAAKDVVAIEPTGVGDAFRAGFLAALEWGLGHERAAAGRLRAGGVRRRDGRHPGVLLHPQRVRQARRGLLRHRRRDRPLAPPDLSAQTTRRTR